MDSILSISIPTMLHAITQCIAVLTIQDLTPKYIKATYTSHFNPNSSQGLRVNSISSREFKLQLKLVYRMSSATLKYYPYRIITHCGPV
jgi:hypothetical protein